MPPRKLTRTEIDYILDGISAMSIHPDITDAIQKMIRYRCESQLESIEIYPEMIEKLKDEICRYYYSSLISPGEIVGILTAQSIGERNTQLVLNSFHKSGTTVSTVIHGVPRFSELMSATKKPKGPLTTIYFKTNYRSLNELIPAVYPQLIETMMSDIILTMYRRTKQRRWYSSFGFIALPKVDIPDDYVCLTAKVNQAVIFDRRLTLRGIANTIEEYFTCICIPSPTTIGILDVWMPASKISDKFIKKFRQLHLSGVSGLRTISYQETKNGWCAEMGGYNLLDIFQLDFVNQSLTMSNHMWELYETLGVEAVREFLIKEFINVVSADSYINIRHIQLMVDMMTFSGAISSISRFGINRNQSGPLAKASFEKTVDNFLKSAMFGEIENTIGVSASIVCGKPSIAGTGLCDVLYDSTVKASVAS